jgi:tRNA pseudouridine13 synthase
MYFHGKEINPYFYFRTKAGFLMTAGTKDKRAITSQLVTLKNTEPLKILNSVRNNPKIAVGNFSFTKQPLQLGNLKVPLIRIHFVFI